MNPDLIRLSPGIAALFSRAGYATNITESEGQLSITVTKGEYSETRLFPYPAVNRDLSDPLRSWRGDLVAAEEAP